METKMSFFGYYILAFIRVSAFWFACSLIWTLLNIGIYLAFRYNLTSLIVYATGEVFITLFCIYILYVVLKVVYDVSHSEE